MKKRFCRAFVSFLLAAVFVLCMAFGAAALDDKYRFEDFGISVKVPKNYYVITRESSRDDEVFKKYSLDYDETMTAFKAADIYLRAYDEDGVFQISLTISENEKSQAINNYSELSDSERKDIAKALSSEATVTTAVEVKHGGIIFFDMTKSRCTSTSATR